MSEPSQFTVAGRVYRIERLRLGEIKALARINEETFEIASDKLLDRFARMVEAVTARFGEQRFVADDDAECTAAELTFAATLILRLAGFTQGDAVGET